MTARRRSRRTRPSLLLSERRGRPPRTGERSRAGRCVESSQSSPRGEPACDPTSSGTSRAPVSGPGQRRRRRLHPRPARRRKGLRARKSPASFFLRPLRGWGPRRGRVLRDLKRRGPFVKGLILAQNERWRRGLGMQVERVQQCTSGARVSKATATNPEDGYSRGKLRVIPSDARASASTLRQRIRPPRDGPSWY